MGDKLLAEIEYSFCVTRNETIIDYFHLDHLLVSRARLSGGARASGAEKKRESGDSGHFTMTLRNVSHAFLRVNWWVAAVFYSARIKVSRLNSSC